MQYLWLLLWWLGFCVLHSILAADWWKERVKARLRKNFVYYRISYSIFAFLHLAIVLFYQFSFKSEMLWKVTPLIIMLIIPFLLAGILIMLISIYKYFFHLSGISVFTGAITPGQPLFRDGLHRYVRHPLYAGTLLSVWCLFILFPLLSNGIACVVITLYTLIGIRWEEKKLIVLYDSYKNYSAEVPMLIPGTKNRKKKLYI